jgi:hypothetical protein
MVYLVLEVSKLFALLVAGSLAFRTLRPEG